MATKIECPGSDAQVVRDVDNPIQHNAGAGAWATATCPVCECRAPVRGPTRRLPQLTFGRHAISAVRYAAWERR
jgi:hypothetical protein